MSTIRKFLSAENYLDRGTLLHRLDPRTKLVILLVYGIVGIIFDNVVILLVAYLVGILCWISSKIPMRNYSLALWTTIGYFAGWSLIGGLFLFESAGTYQVVGGFTGQLTSELLYQMRSNPHVTGIGPFRFYLEGAVFGFERGFKMALPFSIGLVVLWTTGPTKILRGLVKLGLPYIVSFTLSSSIRFLPLFAEEAVNIMDAQKIRGAERRGLLGELKMSYRMMMPLFINTLRRSRELAASVETRGFGARSKTERTYLVDLKLTWEDGLVLAACAIVIALSVYVRFVMNIGYTSTFEFWYLMRLMGY